MNKIVIDANIVLDFLDGKTEVFAKIKTGELAAFAPSFLLLEVSNVLLVKKKLPVADVLDFLTVLQNSGINFCDLAQTKIPELVKLANQDKLTTYDALYLLLAREMDLKLLTHDQDLLAISDLAIDRY